MRLGILNDMAMSGTPMMGTATDYAINSVFDKFLSGNASQTGNSAAPMFDFSNPFFFNTGNPFSLGSFTFPSFDSSSLSGGFSFNFPSFNFGDLFGSSGASNSNNSGPVEFPSFMSQQNIDKIKTLDPDMQKAIVELIKRGHARGIDGIEVNSAFRTHKRQQELYEESIRNGKKGSVAKPGHSRHEFGRAVDLNLAGNKLSPEHYKELGRIWRDEMGFTYGMDFSSYRERWHFDLRPDIRKFGEDNPTLKGIETTWLGKGGQSAVASGGWGGFNWGSSLGSFSFSMPTSLSSGWGGLNFGSFNWGSFINGGYFGMNSAGGNKTRSLKSKYSADIERIVGQYGQYGNDAKLMSCLIEHESSFVPTKVSPAKAKGLTQLMPFNLKKYGVTDPFDPEQSIKGGTLMMNDLLQHYNGDKKLALTAYRNGQPGTDKLLAQYGHSFEAIYPHLKSEGARTYAQSILQRYETASVYA